MEEENDKNIADGDSANEEEVVIEPDNSITGKIKQIFSKVYAVSKSLVGLAILLVLYSALGALIIHGIEYPNELRQKDSVVTTRENVMNMIFNKTVSYQALGEQKWKNETDKILRMYEDAVRSSNYGSQDEVKWSMWGALFFCATIYTTIGYGNLAPLTNVGKVFTIFYAVLGIPLALIVLAEVGKKFTVGLKYGWSFVRRYYYTGYCNKVRQTSKSVVKRGKTALRRTTRKRFTAKKMEEGTANDDGVLEAFEVKDSQDENGSVFAESTESSEHLAPELEKFEIDENFNLPASVACGIMLIYIFVGVIMYNFWEDWSFLDSFYFVVISLSTIGFGDILPAHPKYFLISSVYLFIGLALVSMCINVGIEYLNTTIDKAKVRMDKAKDKMAVVGKQKMEKVGKSFDKAKDRAKTKVTEVRNIAKEKATEVSNIAKEKATEVRKDIVLNVHKEVSKIYRKKSSNGSNDNASGDEAEGDRTLERGLKPNNKTLEREKSPRPS